MKAKITNNSAANQGIWTDEGLVHLEPGKTRTLTIAENYVERVNSLPFLKVVEISAFDHDEDGQPGGSLPASPPSLTGKNKAQLLEIAAAEGVEIEEGATNPEIIAAIELKRRG